MSINSWRFSYFWETCGKQTISLHFIHLRTNFALHRTHGERWPLPLLSQPLMRMSSSNLILISIALFYLFSFFSSPFNLSLMRVFQLPPKNLRHSHGARGCIDTVFVSRALAWCTWLGKGRRTHWVRQMHRETLATFAFALPHMVSGLVIDACRSMLWPELTAFDWRSREIIIASADKYRDSTTLLI